MGCGTSTASPVRSTKETLCEPNGGGDNSGIHCDRVNTANNNNLPCPPPCQARNDNIEECNVYDQSASVAIDNQGCYDELGIMDDVSDGRGWSASSKDSGFNDELADVITESSPGYKVQSVLDEFVPNTALDVDTDLSICGHALRKKESPNTRTREEAHIIRSLQEHGLISRPTAQAPGGLCFEVVASTMLPRKPPPRLAKLVFKKSKRKEGRSQQITTDMQNEMPELIEAAINEETNLLCTLSNVDNNHVIESKMEQARKNRQEHINIIRQKLQEHDHHMNVVKQRKLSQASEKDFFENTIPSYLDDYANIGQLKKSKENSASHYQGCLNDDPVTGSDASVKDDSDIIYTKHTDDVNISGECTQKYVNRIN